MRVIKFRAWDKINKRYLPQEEMEGIGGFYYANGVTPEEDVYEIEQFTGLQDKNGVDIYEGDIVNMFIDYGGDGINEPNNVDEFNGEVIYCQLCCSFGIQSETNEDDIEVPLLENIDIEIIGNIHEEK